MDKLGITSVCIDDFALKKRHKYGTIMVDVETHRVIDMIESREQDDVAKWLSTYPNILVVSRDGSAQYAAAIRQAHPDAIQVSDRFHLIQNLTDRAKEHISKVVAANFRISAGEGEPCVGGGYWDKPECHGADLQERSHIATTEKKRELVGKVRSLAAQGLSMVNIAKEVGISPPTVKKYLDVDFNPAHKDFGIKKPSKLKPYTAKIDSMLLERRKFSEIEAAIREDGYNGAVSTIRMYATRQRRIIKDTNAGALANTEIIERKWLTKLLYKPIEKVKDITENQLERVINEYPVIGILYDIVHSFKEMLSAKRVDELNGWMEEAQQFGIDEINGFINGVNYDLDAVKNAIRFDYNNGLAEGSVNKVKVIKRIMYGRCSFSLLRNKILLRESQ